jgi:hypothetical protein
MRSFVVNKAPAMSEDRIYVLNQVTAANPHLVGAYDYRARYGVGEGGGLASLPTILFEVTSQEARGGGEQEVHALCGLFPSEHLANSALRGFVSQSAGYDRTFLMATFYEGKLHALREYRWAEETPALPAPQAA